MNEGRFNGTDHYVATGDLAIAVNAVATLGRPLLVKGEPGTVVGRNNWLFCDPVAGAHASARLYSLIETAKANGLEPYAYLRHVVTELPKAQSLADIEALLPTRIGPGDLARDSLQGTFPAARQ